MFEHVRASVLTRHGGRFPFQDLFVRLRETFGSLFEENRMGADLLFMITYMASITTASVTRPEIFSRTAARQEYAPARYIKKVEYFVQRWHYSYVEALTIVSEKVRSEMLRSLLNRYANSMEAGVPDEDFLQKELNTMRSVYRNSVEQGLEMLKKWSDAYIAMLFSASLVGIIIMISVAIYSPEGIESSLNTSYLIILVISLFGLFIMYRSVPSDDRTHGLQEWCSWEQGVIRRTERLFLILTLVPALLLLLLGMGIGVAFLLVGILLAPLGLIGYIDDKNIVERDRDFVTFIRSLGSVMGGKGVSTVFALAEVDRKSLHHLEPLVRSVYSRLNLGLNEVRSWERFIGESGSNLIYKYMNIFRDSVELGGSPDRVGEIVSTSMLEQVLLREKRDLFSRSFMVLLVPMHAAMVGIFLFLYHIMVMMSKSIAAVVTQQSMTSSALSGSSTASGAFAGMNLFVNFPEGVMGTYVAIVLLMLTVSNIFAGKIVHGGNRYIYYFYASLLCTITGILHVVAPIVVKIFFNIPLVGGG